MSPERPVRTRFAPSPTGALHLGNLRVAAFNHLFARRHRGAFVLRVEDTDVERTVPGSLERIRDDLRWAGLEWDEGPDVGGRYGPYRQSQRLAEYRAAAFRLVEEGSAYLCFCEEGDEVQRRGRIGGGCPGGCRDLSAETAGERAEAGAPRVVRFAVPEGVVEVIDEIRGSISVGHQDISDFILLRADDRPTYNFAVVVDDAAMEISHVLRGAGHLSNTPRQALLFDAMGVPRPVFAHLPTVLSPTGGKLSKREGAAGVGELRARGYHPDGVVNYLSLLGWSPGDDREVMSREELIREMDLGRVGASDTTYDPEKLLWMSGRHIAGMSLEDLTDAVRPWIDRDRFSLEAERLETAIAAIRTRLSTFGEVNDHLELLLPGDEALSRGLAELAKEGAEARRVLEAVRKRLEAVETWTEEPASAAVREAGREVGARGKALFHPIRLALTGAGDGPELGKILVVQGRDGVLKRLTETLRELA